MAITDLFNRASNGSASPVPTALAAQKSVGAASASLSLATGWPTTTAVHLLMYKVDANNQMIAGTLTGWKATLSGTTLSDLTLKFGTDIVYPAGSVVEMAPTSSWADDIVVGLLDGHTQLGYHKTLKDDNGNEWLERGQTASAVNQVKVTNAATNTNPQIEASGDDTNISLPIKGKGTGKAYPDSYGEVLFDHVSSGLVWSGDSYGSTRNASMTAGVLYVSGVRVTLAAVTARAFTASRDTYVDVGTDGVVDYNEVTNNAASPALAANHIRIAIIITGATSIANAGSVNQGQEDKVLPIASSTAYAVTDSLGNLICPRDPERKVLGYRQATSNFSTTATSATAITGLSVPVIVPTGRKIKVTVSAEAFFNDGAGGVSTNTEVNIYEGASLAALTTQLQRALRTTIGGIYYLPLELSKERTPTLSSPIFYTATLHGSNGAQNNTVQSGVGVISIRVELA